MPTSQQIRADITAKIIAALESGTIPWRRPWTVSPNTGRPTNAVSGKPYQGVNPLLLELHRMQHGFQSKWWPTFRQAEALGCRVQHRPADVPPGQWGCHVVFYRPIEKIVTDQQTGEEKDEKFFILKTYCVFNVDQVSGEAVDRFRVIDTPNTGGRFAELPTGRRSNPGDRCRHPVRRAAGVLPPPDARGDMAAAQRWRFHPDATPRKVHVGSGLLRIDPARAGTLQ